MLQFIRYRWSMWRLKRSFKRSEKEIKKLISDDLYDEMNEEFARALLYGEDDSRRV